MRNAILTALALLGAGCTAIPQERMTTGAGMGAATGCAMGALATVWSGPGALLGCGIGAGMVGMAGMDLGLLTTPLAPMPPPSAPQQSGEYPQEQLAPGPIPLP